jgi:hypothetical protein
MAATQQQSTFLSELAEFFASGPTLQQVLDHHPSECVQERIRELLLRNNEGQLTDKEEAELDEMIVCEMLMRLVKAKIRMRQRTDSHE